MKRIHVIQGDHVVSKKEGDILTTILGSCVATCFYDPVKKVGGMNHFLLPGEQSGTGNDKTCYGLFLMEVLINELMKSGAEKKHLKAKVFGGAKMIEGLSDIGARNATFAMSFLTLENIQCVATDLGGTRARQIRFNPITGAVNLRLLSNTKNVDIPKKPSVKVPPKPTDDVEFF